MTPRSVDPKVRAREVQGGRAAGVGWLSRPVLARAGWALVAIGVVFVGTITGLTSSRREATVDLYTAELTNSVRTRAEVLTKEVEDVQADLLILAERPGDRDPLTDVEAAAAFEEDMVKFCRFKPKYHQVRLIDREGLERIRVQCHPLSVIPAQALQFKGDRYYFQRSADLRVGETFVSRFDLNMEHGHIEEPMQPVIRFATPLHTPTSPLLVVNYLGDALLDQLEGVASRHLGQGMLVDLEGFVLDERGYGFMFDRPPDAPTRLGDGWPAMSEASSGFRRTERQLIAWERVAQGPEPNVVAVSSASMAEVERRVRQHMLPVGLVASIPLLLVVWLFLRLARAAEILGAHEIELKTHQSRLERLSLQLLTAQEEERQRIARDLHDELGQWMTTLHLTLQRASGSVEHKDALIAESLEVLTQLIDRTHAIATQIRPTLLDDLGLEQAARSMIADWERRTGIDTRVDIQITQRPLATAVREHLFRILQEALSNVARHAEAGWVEVTLRSDAHELVLKVRDDGVGLPNNALERGRLGVLGMTERAEILGGRLTVARGPSGGTVVEVWVPNPCEEHSIEN